MITEFAPAKLNLYLHVTGKRPDGYHELDSLVAFADIGDRLTAVPADKFSLHITGPMAGALTGEASAANSIARVTEKLATAVGTAPHVAFTLEKNLPVASGIGGGSADAAAALRALAKLWRLAPDDPRLFMAGGNVGKDIPVCIRSNTQYFSGTGELLDPGPALPATHILLVNPGIAMATPDVFRARTGGFSPAARLDRPPRDAQQLADMLKTRRNDLTEPAQRLAPAIGNVLATLTAASGCLLARMLGSGATCLGLFADAGAAAAAKQSLKIMQPAWWVAAGKMPFSSMN